MNIVTVHYFTLKFSTLYKGPVCRDLTDSDLIGDPGEMSVVR